jgi:hypothetical protein
MAHTTGIEAIKDDPIVSELPVNIDQQQSIDLVYDVGHAENINQIGRVSGGCIKLEYPVKQTKILENRELIESQFAAHNSVDYIDNEVIDQTVHDLIPAYLEREGLELPEDSVELSRVQALILQQIRAIKSTEDLFSYLKENDGTRQLFGFDSGCTGLSPSTLSRTRNEFEMDRQPVQNSIRQIEHILFRNGILENIDTRYNQDQPIPQDSNLSNHLRYVALLNWCDLLLDQLTKGISFGRASNASYTIRQIVASLAIMTYCGNLDRGWHSGQLTYQEEIITPTQIHNIIKKNIGMEGDFYQSKERIELVCKEMHDNLFEFASADLDLLSEPVNIAFDPTWVSMKDHHKTIPGAMGNVELEDNGGFCFLTGIGFSSTSRISLPISLVSDKKKYPQGLRKLLQQIENFADIGWIIADREFDNPAIIEVCRTDVVDTWAIRVRNNHKLIDMEEYNTLQKEGHGVVSFGGTEINAYWKDISDSEWEYGFGDEDDDLFILSGKSSDETSVSNITSRYGDRWSVETLIRQLKHNFAPDIFEKSGLFQLFSFNISSIFYNMCQFINHSLSPRLGLPLQIKTYELLLGIAESTFQHPNYHPLT